MSKSILLTTVKNNLINHIEKMRSIHDSFIKQAYNEGVPGEYAKDIIAYDDKVNFDFSVAEKQLQHAVNVSDINYISANIPASGYIKVEDTVYVHLPVFAVKLRRIDLSVFTPLRLLSMGDVAKGALLTPTCVFFLLHDDSIICNSADKILSLEEYNAIYVDAIEELVYTDDPLTDMRIMQSAGHDRTNLRLNLSPYFIRDIVKAIREYNRNKD